VKFTNLYVSHYILLRTSLLPCPSLSGHSSQTRGPVMLIWVSIDAKSLKE